MTLATGDKLRKVTVTGVTPVPSFFEVVGHGTTTSRDESGDTVILQVAILKAVN